MFKKETYTKRRQRLKKQVGSGVILLLGNEESSMNYKANYYPFRQDSTFLYYFGLDKPGLAAIIDIDHDKEIVFGDDIDLDEIIWTGPVESLAADAAKTGITDVRPLSDLQKYVDDITAKEDTIHFLPPYRPEHAQRLNIWLDIPVNAMDEKVSEPLIKAIVSQRSNKSPKEVEEIEKAINVTIDMQLRASQLAEPGRTEKEVAGEIHGLALSAGGDLSFPTIVTVNGQVLHNQPREAKLQSGDMLLCDCGAETSMHYAGDLTRTFPVDNTFTDQQRKIYNIILKSHLAAIEALRPGVKFKDIHLLASKKLAEGLKEIGLMKGDVEEAVAQGAHEMFFQCGLGHMMGLDTHDMENLGKKYLFGYSDQLTQSPEFGIKALRLGKALEKGFVLTIEPGLYFIPELIDRWKAEQKFHDFIDYAELEKYRGFGGIRIEEDLLITDEGSRLLGKSLPRTAEDIESVSKN
jgi:Xaa-Pro aminopeptidase